MEIPVIFIKALNKEPTLLYGYATTNFFEFIDKITII